MLSLVGQRGCGLCCNHSELLVFVAGAVGGGLRAVGWSGMMERGIPMVQWPMDQPGVHCYGVLQCSGMWFFARLQTWHPQFAATRSVRSK